MSRLGDIAANIFDLLDESDGSSVESGKKAQAALEQKKNAAAAALAPAKPATEKAAPQGKKPTGERRPFDKDRKPRTEGDRPPRAAGDRPPRPAGDRKPRTDRPPRPQGESPKEEGAQRFNRSERRPRKDGEPFVPRGNKREKDRSESGTGRGKEVQKNGAGKGGWGSTEEQAAAVEGVSVTEAVEELKKDGEVASESTQSEEPAKEAEPEEKWGRTLDDYVKEKKKAVATIELRKLEDDGSLNEYTPLKRVDGEFMKIEKKQTENKKVVKESNKKSVPVDQVLKIQAEKKERAPREDRPSRGGDSRRGKGPNQAGEKRKPASSTPAPQLTVDEKAFPSLSKA